VREGNDSYSAFGQCTHSHETGIAPARGRCICQPRDRDGARREGMATPGERLSNIVPENKPKGLAGLGHKGTGAGPRTFPCLVMGSHAPGGQSAPPPCVATEAEHGNPVRFPLRRRVSRTASRRACGYRRREEAHAIRSWEGEGLSPHATSPDAPAGRRPSGLSSQESLANFWQREGR